ncbi:MAG: hypothetical protein H6P95_438 [Candidatus Aminicenantes bacterium]|nr:hypothetical protein [Candidatus Aminicenantes bacterium]
MKKAAIVIILFGCLAGLSFGESNHNVGLGIILGEPTGISFKMWSSETVGFDAGAAWSFVDSSFFQIHGDMLFHNYNIFKVDTGKMALFYGFGARIKFADDTIVSLRVPVGISYEFEKTPIELFLEVAPMLNLTPATEVDIAGGIGFRYYF